MSGVGFPSDLGHWKPMRHHEPDEPLNARAREYGFRYDREAIPDPNTGEQVKIGKDAPKEYGDYPNWAHWKGQKQRTDSRQADGDELGAWYQAMPAMASRFTVKPMATMTRADNELKNKRFITDKDIIKAHSKLTAKPRGFVPAVRDSVYPMWPEGDPYNKRIATGHPGVVLTATYPDEQISLFMPAGNVLISDHRSESPDVYSTMVYDINRDQLSFRYLARLSTAVRVAIAPSSLGTEPGLALLGTKSPKGFGYASFWFNGSFPQSPKPPKPPGPLTGPGAGEPPTESEQARPDLPLPEPRAGRGVYATFSWEKGGPMHPGAGAADKHLHAMAPDGEPWTGGHTDTQSLYYMDVERDAPLAFEAPYYPIVANGQIPYEVHLQYDIKSSHVWQGKKQRGLWRWFVKIPIQPPYDGGPPRTPKYPPPWEPIDPPPGDPIPPPGPEPDPKGPPGKDGPPGPGTGGAVISGDKKIMPKPAIVPGGTPWADAIPPQNQETGEDLPPPSIPSSRGPITQEDEEDSQAGKARRRGAPPEGAVQYAATVPAEIADPDAPKIYPKQAEVNPGGQQRSPTELPRTAAQTILPAPGVIGGPVPALPSDLPDYRDAVNAADIQVADVRKRAGAIVQPAATANEFAAPSLHLVAVPMRAKTLSWSRFSPESELGGFYAAPLVGHFQGAGSEESAGGWDYYKRPVHEGGRGPYISGTSIGVVAFMPPEKQIDDTSPWSTTGTSAQSLLIHPANKLAFGSWSSTLGSVISGFVFSWGNATRLDLSAKTAAGANTTGALNAPDITIYTAAVHLSTLAADPVPDAGTLWFDGTDLWLDATQITGGGGAGDMVANGTDGNNFAAADLLLVSNGNNKTAKDTGIYIDPATNDMVSPANIQAVDIYATGDMQVDGKLTVAGFIDPTGIGFTAQASRPAAATTLGNGAWMKDYTATNVLHALHWYDGAFDQLLMAGGFTRIRATFTATATLTAQDMGALVPVTASVANIVASLPAAASVPAGSAIAFVRTDQSGYTVTVARSGADTINSNTGAWSLLESQNSGQTRHIVKFVSDGASNWTPISSPLITSAGIIPVVAGGTGNGLYVQGDILYASSALALAALNKSNAATRYLSNTGASNNPAWAQVNVANGVTGTLPLGNGGTGGTTADTANASLAGGTARSNNTNARHLGYDGTNGGYFTNTELFDNIQHLTQKTSVTDGYKFAVVDESGNSGYATFEDLDPTGLHLIARTISYTGNGASGTNIITLTGINRAYTILWMRVEDNLIGYSLAQPFGATGNAVTRNSSNGGLATAISMGSEAAGSSQTMTLNTTDATMNANTKTYRILIIGTPT